MHICRKILANKKRVIFTICTRSVLKKWQKERGENSSKTKRRHEWTQTIWNLINYPSPFRYPLFHYIRRYLFALRLFFLSLLRPHFAHLIVQMSQSTLSDTLSCSQFAMIQSNNSLNISPFLFKKKSPRLTNFSTTTDD